MTHQYDWPPHREIDAYIIKSDFDKFSPIFAEAMRAQGMETFAHLVDRADWLVKQPEFREIYGEMRAGPAQIRHLISVISEDRRAEMAFKDGWYTNNAIVVAKILELDIVAAFGPPDQTADYVEVQDTDIYAEAQRRRYDEEAIGHVITRDEFRRAVEGELDKLNLQPRLFLKKRFGFNGLPPRTYGQIAQEFGVKVHRVADVCGGAMIELKQNKDIQTLHETDPDRVVHDIMILE